MVFDIPNFGSGNRACSSFNTVTNKKSAAADKTNSIFRTTSPDLFIPGKPLEKNPADEAHFLTKTCDINSVAKSIIRIIDAKDSYTGQHSKAVQKYAGFFAKMLNLPENEREFLNLGSAFHDIGKIGVPEDILNTEGPLSEEQFAKIKQHPEIGSRILDDLPALKGNVSRIVKHHHEHWDGSGYPNNLAGDNIPFGARIVAIVDSYHAMTSNRPYRKGMPRAEAMQKLKDGAGKQWDPGLIKEFSKIVPLM